MSKKTLIIIGAGIAGWSVAAAVSRSNTQNVDRIIVIERDILPDVPALRPGTPEDAHNHVLLRAGFDIWDTWYPEFRSELRKLDGVDFDMGPQSWLRLRTGQNLSQEGSFGINTVLTTRPVFERVMRKLVCKDPRVVVLQGLSVTSLIRGKSNSIQAVNCSYRHNADRVALSEQLSNIPNTVVTDAQITVQGDWFAMTSGPSSNWEKMLMDIGFSIPSADELNAYPIYFSSFFSGVKFPAGIEMAGVSETPTTSYGASLAHVGPDKYIGAIILYHEERYKNLFPTDHLKYAAMVGRVFPEMGQIIANAKMESPIRQYRNCTNRLYRSW